MAKVCPSCELTYADEDYFCAVDGSPLRSTGADADNLVGTVIADRYRVEAIIGEGGMGRVYRARHVRVPREAAIKVLRRALIADTYAVAAFNREARNAASVGDHPNVAAVYDFGETSDGLVFLAMEYIEGETLSRRLAREPVLSPRRAVEIVRQVAAGLTAAHELPEPVVHRDLKPDNILLKVTRDGTDWVKVVDFGIAKAVKRDTQLLTTPGLVVGTPRYMSPEQLTGGTVDVRSDIYALGMIAFQMLTGRMPFVSSSSDEEATIQWSLQRLTLQPLTLAQVRPDVQWPPAAQQALDRALAPAAADRVSSANEFARSLAHAFGLTTPSGVVGVVAEVPGPVSDALRSATRSTAPTAPISAADATVPQAPPAAASSEPRGVRPRRSRVAAGVAAGVVLVAALSALLWKQRDSGGERTGGGIPSATGASSAGARPNDSAGRQAPSLPSPRADSQLAGGAPRVDSAKSDSAARRASGKTTPPAVAGPTDRPKGGEPSRLDPQRVRLELDRVKAALEDQDAVAAGGTGDRILRELRRLLPSLPTRVDSVEAIRYQIETNLVLDRPAEACRLLAQVRQLSRGTDFEAGIKRFLADSELNCANRH